MTRVPTPAQYLIRIDDLCPTVHQRSWLRLLGILREFGIHPILAVVPDNQDPELKASPPDPQFWEQMRELARDGAAIAIHGYQHNCQKRGKSLIPLHRHTEFAGVPMEEQRVMLETGLAMLRAEGLNPRLWVAPRHGFDRNTLTALRDVGIGYLSDGLARRPFTRSGIVWIPQQVWGPVERENGLWTICLHPSSVSGSKAEELRMFLKRHAAQFTSFDRVITELEPAGLSLGERLSAAAAMGRARLRRSVKRARQRLHF